LAKVDNTEELLTLALLLATVIKNICKERGGLRLSQEPIIEKRDIIEFRQRMRIFSEEKFDLTTVVSKINFYTNEKDMQKHNALGVIVIFLEKEYVPEFMQLMKYPDIEEEEEDAILDACGTFCNLIAGRFKTEIVKRGYADLFMSHFSNYLNTAYEGVEFSNEQVEKYMVSFYISGIKRIVVEMTMDTLPRLKG